MNVRNALMIAAVCVVSASLTVASTINLKNGTTLVGEAHKLGGSYSITMSDGSRKMIPASEIKDIDGLAPGAPANPTADDAAVAAAATAGLATPTDVTAAFRAVKSKADHADAPIVGVQLWEQFIGTHPSSSDLLAAEAEKKVWDKLYKDKAERIKGKWIGGKDLKDLKKKCDDLMKAAVDPESMDVRGVDGMRKLDEILAIYPTHFEANFYKGFYYLVQATTTNVGSLDYLSKAIVALERTAQIAPDVPEVWCNLAIGYNFRREYQKSIEAAYRAVKMRDDEKLVAVLANAIYKAPPQMRDVNPKVRQINEDAQILFHNYNISGPGRWFYVRPTAQVGDKAADDVKRPPGVVWSGSGFFVTADGYLLTNHHVATGDPKTPIDPAISFRVRMVDGSERSAKLIAIGENCDVALMKVETTTPLPFLKIASVNPNQGADAMVLGYPATGFDEMIMQISVGKVKSTNDSDEYHVWYDLNTTHGNSGGPIVDKYGSVISILTAGRASYNMTTVLGVGADQIGQFVKDEQAKESALKVSFVLPPATPSDAPLNSEKLTADCRGSTLLVLAIRGDAAKADGKPAKPGDRPDAGAGDDK